ncbi:MAG: radical SAM protein [Elusimicrobia bacterium]|nr:radical SAM protein [Elusimicrobiota bacterium]
MAVDGRFVLTGAKRVLDSRPFYAQMVVTDDCNLRCAYCDEYAAGASLPPLEELKSRVNRLDELGALVYDLLGGEPLLHPGIAGLVSHVKGKRKGSNLCTIITNGFLLTRQGVRDLNAAGLDFMQVSVDSVEPTPASQKSLKAVLPRLRLLAEEAKFTVEVQTVLCESTVDAYDDFRRILGGLPFSFGFSVQHGPGGRVAIRGEKYLALLRKYGVFEGINFYGKHLSEMLRGDFSRPWKCLAGFKFLYVNGAGEAQWCGQQRAESRPLWALSLRDLRSNDRHKPCEPGCSLGCVRLISHALGQPVRTLGASVRLMLGAVFRRKAGARSRPEAGA